MGGGALDVAISSRGKSGRVRQLGCGLLLVLLSLPAMAAELPRKNPHLQKALQFFDAFEYEAALQVLDKAEQWAGNTTEDRVAIALLEGVLSYETQQPVRGDRAFQRALELDRKAKLTLPVSPKVAGRLEELRAKLPPEKPASPLPQTPPPPPQPKPESTSEPARRMNLKLPVAIGGGVVAVGGILAWGRAKSIEGKVRNADPSITTRAQLDDTLQQGRTFEKVGWVLMGLGAATTAGSLLFLDNPTEGAKATITPVAQGAQLSVSWKLQ
jgi:hypothetical protein